MSTHICSIDDIPVWGARKVRIGDIEIAIFRRKDGTLRALENRCPHKGGPLSEGIVSGDEIICPLHAWRIRLDTGEACEPDEGCVQTYPVRVEGGAVYLELAERAA